MAPTREERIKWATSKLDFREEVPGDVVTRFNDVKDILEVARENERMLRVAIEYTMVTVELALRILSDRLGHESAMDKESEQGFTNLLEWLHKRDYLPHRTTEESIDHPYSSEKDFNRDLPGMYRSLRGLRNSWIHTRNASWLGWGFLRVIPQGARFINRLYTNPRQRRESRKKRRAVGLQGRRLKEGGVALVRGEKRDLLHELNVLYCDVTEDGDVYYVAMWPVFETKAEVRTEEYAPYVAKCTSVCRGEKGKLELRTQQDRLLRLDLSLSEQEKVRLSNWDTLEVRSISLMQFGPATLRSYILGLDRHHFLVSMDNLKWID